MVSEPPFRRTVAWSRVHTQVLLDEAGMNLHLDGNDLT